MKTFFCLLPIMLILLLRFLIVRSNRQPDDGMNEFWAHERQALYARNKDISNIELFVPDMSGLPFSGDSNPESHEARVIASGAEPMLDLHHMTNTDIKIEYGPANFPVISKYDQNYMYFTRDVFNWGKFLYDNKQYDKARIVLEYSLTLSKELSGAYTMLGMIYKDNDEIELISGLIHQAEESDTITSKSTCNTLKNIINSY